MVFANRFACTKDEYRWIGTIALRMVITLLIVIIKRTFMLKKLGGNLEIRVLSDLENRRK